MVLLILVAIWAAVLIPPAVRRRAEGRPSDSITAFHYQLNVLGRAGPRGSRTAGPASPPAAAGLPRRHVALVDPVAHAVAPLPYAASRSALARRTVRRRRRDVLLALLMAAAITLALGAIPGLRMLWLVHVAADVLLVAYVALLVRQRNLATERELKVRLLPTAHQYQAGRGVRAGRQGQTRWLEADSGWYGPEPALLRRSAN